MTDLLELIHKRRVLRELVKNATDEFQTIKNLTTSELSNMRILREENLIQTITKRFGGIKRKYRLTDKGLKVKRALEDFEEKIEKVEK